MVVVASRNTLIGNNNVRYDVCVVVNFVVQIFVLDGFVCVCLRLRAVMMMWRFGSLRIFCHQPKLNSYVHVSGMHILFILMKT